MSDGRLRVGGLLRVMLKIALIIITLNEGFIATILLKGTNQKAPNNRRFFSDNSSFQHVRLGVYFTTYSCEITKAISNSLVTAKGFSINKLSSG